MKKQIVAAALSALLSTNAQAAEKVLIIVSSATSMALKDGRIHPTGYFLGELTEPLEVMLNAGLDFDIATPGGVTPTMNQDGNRLFYWSFDKSSRRRGLEFAASNLKLQSPLDLNALTEADLQSYVGVFVPGGHGPTVDLINSPAVASVLHHFHENKKPTGLLCHGTLALLSAKAETGWPYAGYRMTVVSDREERLAEKLFLRGKVSFTYPEVSLRDAGAIVQTTSLPVRSNVVWDRELVTGQNPYAAREFGEVFVQAVERYRSHGKL